MAISSDDKSKNFTITENSFIVEPLGKKYESREDVLPFVEAINAQKDSIEKVQLTGNSFGIDACIAIAESIKNLTHIKSCLMHDIFTGRLRSEIPKCLDAFCDSLLEKKELEVIDFSDNAFGPDGLTPLVPLISHRTSLSTIRLNNTGLGPEGGKMLADALISARKNLEKSDPNAKSNLKILVCGRSRLENGSMESMSEALKLHASLREIVLPQDGIRPEGIVSLMKGIEHCSDLEILDLQDNTFTEKGAEALAQALPKIKNIRKLNVGDCMLTAKGCLGVIDSLRTTDHKDLEVLNFQYNEMNETGAKDLALILNKYSKLESLELNGNNFDAEGDGAEAVRDALKLMDRDDVLGSLSDMEEESEEEEEEEEDLTEEISKVSLSN